MDHSLHGRSLNRFRFAMLIFIYVFSTYMKYYKESKVLRVSTEVNV